MANRFLVAIARCDSAETPRLALLFLVRADMRKRGLIGTATPRQALLEAAASTYPLPPSAVECAKMLIAARTRGLVTGNPVNLTDAGHALLTPFDQEDP